MIKSIMQNYNINSIKTILSLENMYSKTAFDDSPYLGDLFPEGVWINLYEDGNIAGIVNLKQLNNVMWQPHIYILEAKRNKGSEEWGKQVAEYMSKKYDAKKFLAMTPYKNAKKYAQRIGFKQIAVLTKSIQKNGELLDQYVLEM